MNTTARTRITDLEPNANPLATQLSPLPVPPMLGPKRPRLGMRRRNAIGTAVVYAVLIVAAALTLWGDERQQAAYLPAFTGDDVPAAELANYCLHALAAAGSLPSKAAVQRLVTVTLAGLRSPADSVRCRCGHPSPASC